MDHVPATLLLQDLLDLALEYQLIFGNIVLFDPALGNSLLWINKLVCVAFMQRVVSGCLLTQACSSTS